MSGKEIVSARWAMFLPREGWGPDFAVDRLPLPWPMLRAWNGAASREGPAPVLHRRGGRVVECARLESVCRATYRGFEALPLRQCPPWLGLAGACRVQPLEGQGAGEP